MSEVAGLDEEGVAPALHGAAPSGRQAGSALPDPWNQAWKILRRRPAYALVVAILLAIGAGLAGAFHVLAGPTIWTSRTVMMINDPYELAAGNAGELKKLDELRLEYASLANTAVIARPVATLLHLPPAEVASSTAVYAAPGALLIYVYGRAGAATEAEAISAAVAHELSSYASGQESLYGVPAHDRYVLSVVDPTSPARPSGPSEGKAAGVGIGLGVLGFLVGFLAVQLARGLGSSMGRGSRP